MGAHGSRWAQFKLWMVGQVGAIVATRNARRNGGGYGGSAVYVDRARMEQSWKEYERKVQLNKIVRKFDKNKSGKLERAQVMELLTAIDSSTPEGTQPSDEETDWVIKVADKAGDGCIDAGELQEAIACWMTYVDKREEMERMVEKYDVSKTGKLSRDEVKAYLTDLNGGKEVTEEELDMVFKAADAFGDGQIHIPELQIATACWYGYVERKKNFGCCTVQ